MAVSTPSTIYSPILVQLLAHFLGQSDEAGNDPLLDKYKKPVLLNRDGTPVHISKEHPVTGIAHVTGGGMPGKLWKLMAKCGIQGAMLDDLNPVPEIMAEMQEMGNLHPKQAYTRWNGGHAHLITVKREATDDVLGFLQSLGVDAKVVGGVTNEISGIKLVSQYPGVNSGEIIPYTPEELARL